jgi:predicted dinucleotide-binding enzyme
MNEVIVVIGAGSIGQAIARRVAQARTCCWPTCVRRALRGRRGVPKCWL